MSQRIAFIIPLVDFSNPNPAAIGISDYGQKILQSTNPYFKEIVVLAHTTSGKIETSTQKFGKKPVKVIRCWKPQGLKSPLFLFSLFNTVVNVVKVISSEGSAHVHIEYDSSHAYGGTMGEPIIVALVTVKFLLRRRISVLTHCVWKVDDIRKYVAETTGSKILASLYSTYYRLMLSVLFTTANSIITLTMHQGSNATEIVRSYAPRDKVFEVVHGVPEGTQSLLSTDRYRSFTALVFGSIRPGKDFETAVLAFAEFLKITNDKDAKLIIAGSPGSSFKGNFTSSYVCILKHLCKEQGIEENVIFDVRYMPQTDVDDLFRRSNVLLLLYKRRVGPSGIFAQAMSSRLPTIINVDDNYATRKSPLPAVLIEGSELAVMTKAVAKAMVKIKDDAGFRQRLAAAMLEYSQTYSYQEAAEKYFEIFTRNNKDPTPIRYR